MYAFESHKGSHDLQSEGNVTDLRLVAHRESISYNRLVKLSPVTWAFHMTVKSAGYVTVTVKSAGHVTVTCDSEM